MARFRNSLRPINSRKHTIDTQGALVIGTQSTVDLATTVDAPVLANTTEVGTASTINSIFLNVQVADTTTGALSNVYMFVWKNPGSNIAIAQVPNGNAVGTSDMKKLVFHQEMLMLEKNSTGIPRTLFKGVLKLPRHMRRFGHNDELRLELFSPGVIIEFCVQCIYKELR